MGNLGAFFNSIFQVLVAKFKVGGPLMYVLLVMSIIALGFVLDRMVYLILQNLKLTPKKFLKELQRVFNDPAKSSEQKVNELVEYLEKRGGFTANCLIEPLTKWKEAREAGLNLVEFKTYLNNNFDEKVYQETHALEARMDGLGNIATLGPLVGLLGTVIGLIIVFEILANSPGGVKPDELSGGIAVKLVNTAGGLFVAIPALICHGILKFFIDNRLAATQESGKYLVDELAKMH